MLVSKRSERVCNFMNGDSLPGAWGEGTKLIYRHYATLFFVFACEETESELGILDLIQVFVETLDKCFETVCELDLIFHADKIHYVLDEIVMGGLVLETNMQEIVLAINSSNKLERQKEEDYPSSKPKELANEAVRTGKNLFSKFKS